MNTERRLTIGIILDTFPNVSETFILNHITGLIDAGHEVKIFAGQRGIVDKIHPDVVRYRLMDKTIYLPMQARGFGQLINLPSALMRMRDEPRLINSINIFRYGLGVLRLRALFGARYCIKEHIDVIHCHYGHIGWAFLCLKGILGVPMVTSFHGNEFKTYYGWGGFVYSRLFQQGDAIVANGLLERERLKRLGCPESKIVEIPEPLNDCSVKPREDILSERPVKILTVARLNKEKGVQYGLHAMANLRKRGYPVKYTVVGDGPWREELENKAESLGINDIVEFTGWLDQREVYKYFAQSDIFVLASIENRKFVETQGLVIQEAQIHGLGVVASNTGGVPQSVNHGEAGLLFEAGNAEDLTAKLQMLLDYPEVARGIAKAGMEYCKGRYSKSVTTSQMVALYNLLLDKQ